MTRYLLYSQAGFHLSLTCSVCNQGNRIFYGRELICPLCSGIKLADKSKILTELKDKLKKDIQTFSFLISKSDYRNTLDFVLKNREEAARTLIEMPDNEQAAKTWLTCLFLLANLPKNPFPNGKVTPLEVLLSANEVMETLSSITLYEQDKIAFLESGIRCDTERQILFRISTDVDRKLLGSHGFQEFEEHKHILEQMMKLLMVEHVDAIDSESLSRNFRACFPKYLLPYKDSKELEAVVKISYGVSFFVATQLGRRFSSSIGILAVTIEEFHALEKQLLPEFGSYASDIFSAGESNLEGDNLAFHVFIEDVQNSTVYLPYYSLILLAKISYRYVSDMNAYRSRIGDEPEDWIHNFLKGYLNTVTPDTKQKLLRLRLGGNSGEIDAAGYNNEKIVIVESKFRESITVSEIESELSKFEQTLNEFIKRKEMYGFSGSQEIIPLFYHPWAPFPSYGGASISLISSLATLIVFLTFNFPPKDPHFVKVTNSISDFLKNDTEERLFMSDLSDYLDVEEDTFRIQDIQVAAIDESEVTVYAYAPIGHAFQFVFDLDSDCLSKCKLAGVKKGSVLRACTYNLNGNWTLIQLVDFKVLYLDKQFDPDKILAELNQMQYGEFLAHLNAGKNAEELMEFTSRNGINLKRFLEWSEATGFNTYVAVARLMGRSLFPGHKFFQCKCGEVVSMLEGIYNEVVRRYGKDLRCKNCDPSLYSKMEEIGGHKLFSISFSRDP